MGGRLILKLCVLASGSSGNAIYLESPHIKLLIDAGLSGRELNERLRGLGLGLAKIGAVLISHEHSDHLQGAGALGRRYRIPLYLNAGTHRQTGEKLKGVKEIRHFTTGQAFPLEDLWIEPFSVPHDAADPVGFNFYQGDRKLSVALDLGYPTRLIRERMKGAQLIVLESNHDVEMLMKGPYPWPLKQRILGKMGHLSNRDSSSFLADLLHAELSHVVLAHLSQTNNRPELARDSALATLQGQGAALHVARQDTPTEMIAF
ncbi:MAG: MBL fold metallo-hydrolase [Candidatus Tectomicrobia bacterium]|uniref:MBL fold metallo-hydrolase n=1 Tax=Tectimicrobiota bacterium TaxID=2528274 RepID=A0A932FXD8_UNCTE|nr:MBL fold metallo-hydrolase [Candidatus Tectomicrobia bacterium]